MFDVCSCSPGKFAVIPEAHLYTCLAHPEHPDHVSVPPRQHTPPWTSCWAYPRGEELFDGSLTG